MSANNYIRIEKTSSGYEVSHRDYDTDKTVWVNAVKPVDIVDTAEEALEIANRMEEMLLDDMIGVEYGIRYVDKTKDRTKKVLVPVRRKGNTR